MNNVDSLWHVERKLLVTRLQGDITVEDVRRWKASLERELSRIEENGQFKLIVDLYGYELKEMEAHKEMRTVIPLMLAGYGFRTALLDLFDPVELPLRKTRGITCLAMANVHHDSYKMEEYDRRLGRANERFFTDFEQAEAWIEAI